MSDSRWQRVEEIFHQAAELAPEARSAFLDEVCAGDEALRKEVESRLAKAVADATGSTVTMVEDLSGRTIGPYKVLERLGEGGMGVVYKARDTRLGRSVALKFIKAPFSRHWEREARAVAALNHPHIATLYEVGEHEGVPYLAMELVEGRPLKGPLPVKRAIECGIQIADALAAAHAAGVVHRDLKPANIFVSTEGRVKILDFGLARLSLAESAEASTATATQPGVVMGTVGYMSPEQVKGQPADHRADLFSLGVILYEMLAGHRAFTGGSPAEVLSAILKDEPPEAPMPPALERIVRHCLEKEPSRRFQSAHDLAFALESAAGGGATAEHAGAAARSKRKLALWLGVAAAALLLPLLGYLVAQLEWRAPQWTPLLLGGPPSARQPRLAPDGHTLAFRALAGQQTQVAVMKPESGDWMFLTHQGEKGSVHHVSWSPDGTRIYYDRYTDVPRGIFSVPVFGGKEQLVLEDAITPEALPDGSLLVVRVNAEKRYQLFRYWPDSGRLQGYPVDASPYGYNLVRLRAFPNGREALVAGALMEAGVPRQNLYRVDLASGEVRPFATSGAWRIGDFGISRDGKELLMASSTADGYSVVALPTAGIAAARIEATFTAKVHGVEAGADGSLYVSVDEHEYSPRRFPSTGGPATSLALFSSGSDLPAGIAVLATGGVVVRSFTAGRSRLMVAETGKEPAPLLNTSEETGPPFTMVGRDEIAFVIGPTPKFNLELRPRAESGIGLASTVTGRIIYRLPFTKGSLDSLSAAPGGQTLYAAASGSIWRISLSGGEPVKLRAGRTVVVDPAGQYLVVGEVYAQGVRLVQVPLNGGPERQVQIAGAARPVIGGLSNGLDRHGRLVMPFRVPELYFDQPAVLDLATGRVTLIPVEQSGDYESLTWTPDGQVVGLAGIDNSKLWRLKPTSR